MFALKMIPKDVVADCEIKAEEKMKDAKPKNWIVGSLIILIWSIMILWIIIKAYKFLS